MVHAKIANSSNKIKEGPYGKSHRLASVGPFFLVFWFANRYHIYLRSGIFPLCNFRTLTSAPADVVQFYMRITSCKILKNFKFSATLQLTPTPLHFLSSKKRPSPSTCGNFTHFVCPGRARAALTEITRRVAKHERVLPWNGHLIVISNFVLNFDGSESGADIIVSFSALTTFSECDKTLRGFRLHILLNASVTFQMDAD